ncbi:MAG: hypothetical protein IKB07_10700 [Lachnospiraceae bacterium]|nr:hypothetical protein [Lachnospiraceae bacterium]
MKTSRSVFGLLCCILLLFGAGCTGKQKGKELPTGTADRSQYMDEAVVVIDGEEVGYREAMLYLLSAKQEYESAYGEEIWQYQVTADGASLGEWVKEQTLEQLIYIKIVCAQAKRLGISLDSEEKSRVAERTEAYMKEAEYETLALYGIGRKDVERVYEDTALAQKIYDSVTLNVDTDIPEEEAAQKRLQSLMIKNYHEDELGNRTSLTVQELIATLDRFETLYKEATETDDFYSLAYANTEEKTYLDITVGEGDLPEEFKAAYDLAEGEAMQIRTDRGYYIFYCVSERDEDATLAKKEALIAKRQEETFRELYTEWKNEAEIKMQDAVWEAMGYDLEEKE